MEVIQSITLNDSERITVSRFLKLADEISDIAGCSMDNVFTYFVDKSEITENNGYSISAIHEIKDIK